MTAKAAIPLSLSKNLPEAGLSSVEKVRQSISFAISRLIF